MITPRLDSILKAVTCRTIADIGTDHAYIPIELVRSGRADRALACDIKPGPLEFAANNIKKYNLEDKIELRLGGGFTPIAAGETETAVIAGMGGEMIIKILAEDLSKSQSFKELILQPMNCQAELRKWLAEHGFCITAEDLSCEGFKVYNTLTVKRGKGENFPRELDWHLPQFLYHHSLFGMLKDKKRREFTKICTGLMRAEQPDAALIEKYKNLLKELEDI